MSTNQLHDWTEARLWKELQQRGPAADDVITATRRIMNDVQRILQQAGTSPVDFTLHDAQHAFRVAERMFAIMPSGLSDALSKYELQLLLLAAYLHDLGMTPTRQQLAMHHHFLLTGRRGDLSAEAVSEFANWLLERDETVTAPLNASTPDDFALAEELISYYARHKHNDWSVEWIRLNLASDERYHYTGWADTVANLCASHHWGLSELRDGMFDPRLVAAGEVVHLRYLACVLRVADILENDPERTPNVLFKHRQPVPASRVFWWKDHVFATDLVRQENGQRRVVVHARPTSAWLHRAVLDTVSQIEAELALCRQIDDHRPFSLGVGLPALPHRWDIQDGVTTMFAADLPYVYIDGAFRPNTRRLLNLLAGRELYRSPWAAVRELLQNAYDAVKEQLAIDLLRAAPGDRAGLLTSYAGVHSVTFRIERRDGHTFISCEDTGVGMSKRIIEEHFLVSGARKPSATRLLEERCREAGVRFSRTGEFGIGALSYFMIADHVTIETQRSQEAGDGESHGWKFETDGIGSFGELRKLSDSRRGTRVTLRVRNDFAFAGDSFHSELAAAVRNIVVRCPCATRVIDLDAGASAEVPAGWSSGPVEWAEWLARGFFGNARQVSRDTLLPQAQVDDMERDRRLRVETFTSAIEGVEWFVQEGILPGDKGAFRIIIPRFATALGRSAALLCVDPATNSLAHVANGLAWVPDGHRRTAWKGISVPTERAQPMKNLFLELDLDNTNDVRISLDRNSLNEDGGSIEVPASAIRAAVAAAFPANEPRTELLNRSATSQSSHRPTVFWWVQRVGTQQEPTWREIKFPAINSSSLAYRALDDVSVTWRKQEISLLTALPTEEGVHWKGLWWCRPLLAPDMVVAFKGPYGLRPTSLWTDAPVHERDTPIGPVATFPPSWANIVGYRDEILGRTIFNVNHPLLSPVVMSVLPDVMREMGPFSLAMLPKFATMLRNSPSAAQAWCLLLLANRPNELEKVWTGICERYSDVVSAIFASCPLDSAWLLLSEEGVVLGILSFTRQGAIYERSISAKRLSLPVVETAWRIDVRGSQPSHQ